MTTRESRTGRRIARVLNGDDEHALKNHLAVILGFCELLLMDLPANAPRHDDIVEMHRAATNAIALLDREPEV